MARPRGTLERSLANITIGMAQGQAERKRVLQDTITGEYEQQLQVPVTGNATADVVWEDRASNWEMPFLYAPLQRKVPFATPLFGHGVEMISGQAAFVDIRVQLVGWITTEEAWFVGATIRYGVSSPGAVGLVPFSALVHLRFQGYATMAEAGEFAR